MACIMVILDGLQDDTYNELDGKTPFDWGKGESLREIEKCCARGRFVTTPHGFEPDTQTCILTLLGVDSKDIPSGRSYIEAVSLGIPVKEDDIVLRCNFVKVAPNGTLENPTCAPPVEVASQLKSEVAAIQGHSIIQVGSYKSLQIISHGGRHARDMVTFPPHNYAGKPFEDLLPRGNELADCLADFSRKQLESHSPYTVFNWAQSVACTLPSFSHLHNGMTGAMVSATHAPKGCAILMGMACPNLPTATGDTDTDLQAKLESVFELAKNHDFVMLHIGGPDEATHRKDVREKAEFIKKIDAEIIAPILNHFGVGDSIMITSDHVALCKTGGHTTEPVEFMLYKKGECLSNDFGEVDGKKAIEIMGN